MGASPVPTRSKTWLNLISGPSVFAICSTLPSIGDFIKLIMFRLRNVMSSWESNDVNSIVFERGQFSFVTFATKNRTRSSIDEEPRFVTLLPRHISQSSYLRKRVM